MTRLHRAGVWLFGREGDVVLDVRIQVMVLAAATLVTGTVVMSPLVSDLARVFSVSESRGGLIMIVMALPQPLLVPVSGIIADRLGRRPVFVAGLLLFGVAGGAIVLTTSFNQLLVCRFFQGVGFSAAMPMTVVYFGDLYDGARETTAQSFRMVGINAVYILSPFVAGVLFVSSWTYPFLLYLVAIPVGVVAWIVLPRVEPADTEAVGAYLRRLFGTVRDPIMALYLASFAVRFVLLFGFMTYVSVLATGRFQLAVALVGTIVAVKGAASLVGSTQGGRFVDIANPSYVVAAGFAISAVGLVSMGLVTSAAGLFVATVVFGVGDGIVSPAQKSTVNQIVPTHLRGGSMSIAIAFQTGGKVIGPSLFGLSILFLTPAETFAILGLVGGALGMATVLVPHWLNGRA